MNKPRVTENWIMPKLETHLIQFVELKICLFLNQKQQKIKLKIKRPQE